MTRAHNQHTTISRMGTNLNINLQIRKYTNMSRAFESSSKNQQKNKRKGGVNVHTNCINQHKGKGMVKKGKDKKKCRALSYHSALFFNLPLSCVLPVRRLERKLCKKASSKRAQAVSIPRALPRHAFHPPLQRRPTIPSNYSGLVPFYFTDELVIRTHSCTTITIRELLAPLQP